MRYSRHAGGWLVGLLPVMFLCGCTFMTVTKLPPEGNKDGVEGIKYSLPKPYIQVTPQEDGSVIAEVVYLPDPDHTYVIHGSSYLASHNLAVTTEEGLLKKVAWTGDSAAVVSQGIASTAAIAEKQLTAKVEAAKAFDARIDTARKAVEEAKIAVETAQSKLELLVANNADPDEILKAKIDLNAAQIKLAHALANLDRLQGVPKSDDAGLDPNADIIGPRQLTQIAGPILYSINERVTSEGRPTVKLVGTPQKTSIRSSKQPKYPADAAYKPPKEPTKPPEFFPKGVEGLRPDQNGNMQLIVIASSPLFDVVNLASRMESNGSVTNLPPISVQTPTTVRIQLAGTLAGEYKLSLAYLTEKDGAPKFADIKFRVLP